MKSAVNTIDERLVEGVEALEEFLNDHEAARFKLKKGYLMLTKAKLQLPEYAMTEISYHEEFQASRVVMLDSEGKWQLQDASRAILQERNENTVRSRKAGKSTTKATSPRNTQANLPIDTLMWFSSLPPNDLRRAQKQFISGLQALLVAAASAHKVQKAVNDIVTESS